VRRSASSSTRRVKRTETSTARGAVSVETEYETEQLPPIAAIRRKTRKSNPGFDTADSIRSRGMSVRIDSTSRIGGDQYETDHWNGS
jgi:hypothetical protein